MVWNVLTVTDKPWLRYEGTCKTEPDRCLKDSGNFCWYHGTQQRNHVSIAFELRYPKEYSQIRESSSSLAMQGRRPKQGKVNSTRIETKQGKLDLGEMERPDGAKPRHMRTARV